MKFFGAFFLLLGFCLPVWSTTSITDTIIAIDEVVAKSARFNHYGTGTMVYSIDSSVLQQTSATTLGEVLSMNSLAQVKTYGPGNVSSLSIRGGSNTHTLLVWNGFGLRSSTHGGCNYSSLPISAINHVSVQHGGSSTMYGSGAATGIIFISSKLTPDNSGLSAGISAQTGSFASHSYQTHIKYARNKTASAMQIAFNQSANNYTYTNTEQMSNPTERLVHAAYKQFSITQQNSYKPGKQQLLETDVWYTLTYSEAPSLMSNRNPGTTHQIDHDFRSAINYSYYYGKGSIKARAGAFTERNMYFDNNPAASVKSGNNQAIRLNVEGEANYELYPAHKIYGGMGYQHEYGLSNAFADHPQRERISFFGRYKASVLKDYLMYTIEARQDIDDATPAPFVYSLGIEQNIWGGASLKATLKKHYSLPTMNQIYWEPDAFAVGNDSLLPEYGWDYQIGILHQYKTANWSIKNELTAFKLDIDNWIVWLPVAENGKYTPVNRDKVTSKGLEFIGDFKVNLGDAQAGLNYLYAYTDARAFEYTETDTLSYPKIYSPKHKMVLGLLLSYKSISANYTQTNVSERFIDGAGNYLDGYYLANFSLAYKLQFNRYHIRLNFTMGNVYNTSYQLTNGYPMPPRNYQIGIQFKL